MVNATMLVAHRIIVMALRLFLAIPVPASIADRLATLESDVPGASWRTADQYHLTLRFIGEVDEAVARDIDTEVGRIVAASFEIALQGVGSFGGREPSALWAGVSYCPALIRLAGACETAIRNAGIPPEPRRYKPHVTVAYLHGTRDVEVAHFLSDAAEFRTEAFIVDHFCMYSSRATRAGSHYVEEAVYPLTG
ncbi:MAG: 2'-5' RNA ligase [Rhodobacterales bacterium 12-64-8]|nr:MAG: 2'-5' RNA ligase [Rhodobacterales bacterium 12-64-8]OYX46960.1 MAG: 2'-5' RNA ligase [Alphaproteobacteria bacterium 32-64-14]